MREAGELPYVTLWCELGVRVHGIGCKVKDDDPFSLTKNT
jgi:hypothetical protein